MAIVADNIVSDSSAEITVHMMDHNNEPDYDQFSISHVGETTDHPGDVKLSVDIPEAEGDLLFLVVQVQGETDSTIVPLGK